MMYDFIDNEAPRKVNKWKHDLIKDLINKYPSKIAFGGSFALNAYGIIDRRVDDVDIVVNENDADTIKEYLQKEFKFEVDTSLYGGSEDITEEEITHMILNGQNIKVCIFGANINVNKFPVCKYYLYGHVKNYYPIKISPIEPIIKAKKQYIDNLTKVGRMSSKQRRAYLKHQSDVELYYKWKENGSK